MCLYNKVYGLFPTLRWSQADNLPEVLTSVCVPFIGYVTNLWSLFGFLTEAFLVQWAQRDLGAVALCLASWRCCLSKVKGGAVAFPLPPAGDFGYNVCATAITLSWITHFCCLLLLCAIFSFLVSILVSRELIADHRFSMNIWSFLCVFVLCWTSTINIWSVTSLLACALHLPTEVNTCCHSVAWPVLKLLDVQYIQCTMCPRYMQLTSCLIWVHTVCIVYIMF